MPPGWLPITNNVVQEPWLIVEAWCQIFKVSLIGAETAACDLVISRQKLMGVCCCYGRWFGSGRDDTGYTTFLLLIWMQIVAIRQFLLTQQMLLGWPAPSAYGTIMPHQETKFPLLSGSSVMLSPWSLFQLNQRVKESLRVSMKERSSFYCYSSLPLSRKVVKDEMSLSASSADMRRHTDKLGTTLCQAT